MRVLWLTQYPYPNSQVHPAPWLASLSAELVKAGINLTILSYYKHIAEQEYFEKDGIKFIFLKAPSSKIDFITLYQLRIKRMNDFVKKNHRDYDIIHVHGSEQQLESAVIHLHKPAVLSVQGIIFEYLNSLPPFFSGKTKILWKLAAWYEKRNLKQIKYFMCRTKWDKGVIQTVNPSARIFETWEVIRPQFFADTQFSSRKYILFVGGTNPVKGTEEALMAFDTVKKTLPLKLLIIGGGGKAQIEELIKKNMLSITEADYDFRGFQDADGIIACYRESFCLLHPSYIDNSPNSVCEAQIAGLPVIATNVGGVSSLIEHRETGILVSMDVAEMSRELIALYSDTALYNRIAANAMEIARKRHAPEDIVRKTIEVYKTIIDLYAVV